MDDMLKLGIVGIFFTLILFLFVYIMSIPVNNQVEEVTNQEQFYPELPYIKKPKVNHTSLMIQSLNPKVDVSVANKIANSVDKYCEKYSLSVPLVVSLMFRESGFNPLSISKAKCIGLMQINPKAHPNKVKPYKYTQLYHIDVNVDIGCKILKEYLSREKSVKGALERYLGANNKGYIMDVLAICVELSIKN